VGVVPTRVLLLLALTGACDRSREASRDPPRPQLAALDAAPAPVAQAAEASPSAAPAPAPTTTPEAAPAQVIAAGISSPEPAGAAHRGELVVTVAAPKPGTASIVTFDAALDFDLNFGGLKMVTVSKQSKKKRVEIRAVDPDGTVHKRITYLKRDTHILVDGEPKKDPSPIRGKTYLATWKDGIVDVQLPSGKPASDEEAAAVRKEEGQLQSPELLGRALVGLRLVEGQPFEVPIAALEKLVKGDFHPRRMVLTYRGKTRDGARIDAEGALANDGAGLKMYLDLKAELLLDATGWCRSAKVTGQVRAELNGAVVGSGAGTGTVLASPLR
jgi:hypothetical protein